MKKIKTKIKRFLAYWLKDELLEFIGYNPNIPHNTQFITQYNFETARIDAVIPLPVNQMEYEHMLEDAKRKLFKAAEPFFVIRTEELTSPEFQFCRRVYIELYLGKKQ